MPSFPHRPAPTDLSNKGHPMRGRESKWLFGGMAAAAETGHAPGPASTQRLTWRFFAPFHALPYVLPIFLEDTWRGAIRLIGLKVGPISPDWPSVAIQRGIREAFVRDRTGALLAVYTAEIAGMTYVLHSVRKKAWKTDTAEIRQAIGHFDNATKEATR